MSDEWVIVSNGPSIKALTNDDLPQGRPTVAINHAILHPKLHFQYWCAMEEADRFSNELFLKADPIVEVWCGKPTAWTFERKNLNIRVEAGKHQLPLKVYPTDSKKLATLAGFHDGGNNGKPAPWGRRSILSALAICVSHGAKVLHVFGVDMEGERNYGGIPTGNASRAHSERMSPERQAAWADRWHTERPFWEECVEACKGHGVRVVRHQA